LHDGGVGIKARLLIVISLLVVILVVLSGLIVFRNYLVREGVRAIEKTVYVTVTETVYGFLTETTTVKTVLTERTTVTVTGTVVTVTTGWRTDEGVSCILFRTSKDVYEMSEPVVLRLINKCGFNIVLPNSAPWLITDSGGRVVFSPAALQVITTVRPSEVREWTWDQRDNEGNPVPPGAYTAKLMTVNSGMLSTIFEIE